MHLATNCCPAIQHVRYPEVRPRIGRRCSLYCPVLNLLGQPRTINQQAPRFHIPSTCPPVEESTTLPSQLPFPPDTSPPRPCPPTSLAGPPPSNLGQSAPLSSRFSLLPLPPPPHPLEHTTPAASFPTLVPCHPTPTPLTPSKTFTPLATTPLKIRSLQPKQA